MFSENRIHVFSPGPSWFEWQIRKKLDRDISLSSGTFSFQTTIESAGNEKSTIRMIYWDMENFDKIFHVLRNNDCLVFIGKSSERWLQELQKYCKMKTMNVFFFKQGREVETLADRVLSHVRGAGGRSRWREQGVENFMISEMDGGPFFPEITLMGEDSSR